MDNNTLQLQRAMEGQGYLIVVVWDPKDMPKIGGRLEPGNFWYRYSFEEEFDDISSSLLCIAYAEESDYIRQSAVYWHIKNVPVSPYWQYVKVVAE